MEEGQKDERKKEQVPTYVQTLIEAGAPIDRGWAWVVCFAAFLIHILIAGFTRSCGLLFIEVVREFEGTKAQTSVMISVFIALAITSAPVANWLSQKSSPRIVILIGGFLTSFGIGISSFMPSLALFITVFSSFAGCGYGFLFTPSIAVVSQYFFTRRSLAVALSMCGSGFGAFIVPPLVGFLVERFTFRGALLILSAIFLNTVVSASLMRPFHFYTRHATASPLLGAEKKTEGGSSSWRFWRWPLLRNPRLYLVALSMAIMTEGSPLSYILIPPFAADLGINRTKIPTLLLMMGVPDILGRLGFGWFADKGLMRRWHLIGLLSAFESLLWCCITFWPRFETLAVFAVLMGVVGGAVMSLFGPVVADTVGIANINAGLGFTMVMKLVMLPVPIMLGAIRDVSGKWVWSYRIVAILILVSSLLLLLNKCIDKRPTNETSAPQEDPNVIQMDPVEDLIVHKPAPT